MKALTKAVADVWQNPELPAHVWGVTRSARPLITEVERADSDFVLIVTYDDARAEKLYQDYKFYDRDVFIYPAKDALFYYADIHGNVTAKKRLEIIKRIYKQERTVIIATIDGLMDKLPDMKYIRKYATRLAVGDEYEMSQLKDRLIMLGYEHVSVVEASGQFSVRGGIVDIYPLTEECPCRVEFFGDEIDSIRYFDIDTQRSIEELKEIEVFPASEYVLSQARRQRGTKKIQEEADKVSENFKKTFKTEQYARITSNVKHIMDEILEYNSTSGMDNLVDYFFSDTVSIMDYLPKDSIFVVDEPEKVLERARVYSMEFSMSMEGRLTGGYILPGQAGVLYDKEMIIDKLSHTRLMMFSEFYRTMGEFGEKQDVSFNARSIVSYNGDVVGLVKELKNWRKNDYRVAIVTPSATRGKRLAKSLEEEGVPAFFTENKTRELKKREICITTGNVPEGFEIPDLGLAVLSESDIVNEKSVKKRKKLPKKYQGAAIATLDDINVGDYVVHERHGIGVYKGIEKVTTSDGRTRDYINIDYADGGKLFIPVEQLSLIGKYAGKDARKPKLNKLGGTEWTKTRTRVRSNVDDIADELISLYAIRKSRKGYSFSKDTVWQTEFEELFPYDETPDQLRAIEDTKRDMESDNIMDRLICGDVGFGKTEVAIRAAFKAVQDGKQVAYLVPTTILAEQHFETFNERMKGYPIEIRMMSRFCTPKQIKENLDGLAKGKIDIVIGTHRLLSKDVVYKDLGLLIIDEEQRFGVKHKETIKQLKKTVDVLTLTATPIPRTLHMSLIGIRDMSLLEEAPVDRRPIQTYVMENDREIVKEAISRELARGGQVYYVYNRVDDIERITLELKNMLPDASIEFAHGKMHERELENIMHNFINKEIDVLVSTTIIETGLDIPNVNTIIIHNADNFGLAQLYQLRGRVGRSDRSAYAFLMYRRDKVIREVAEKRLSAIREFTELGSGYKISMKDLEIRGAGNLLGSSQSGHMEEVGYDLYVKMLNSAIRQRMGEKVEEEFDTQIDLPVDAFIPDEYVRNEYLKLELYKRISKIEDTEDAEALVDEMKDRFGAPPKEVERLIKVALIKSKAHGYLMTDIRYRMGEVQYIIKNGTEVRIEAIADFIKKYKGDMSIIRTKESGFAVKTSSLIQDSMLDIIDKTVEDIGETLIVTKDESEA